MIQAAISEIYASLQGEGPYAGQPQIFVRVAGCPLRCNYCDTPGSLSASGHPMMTAEAVLKDIKALSEEKSIHVVSVTGGEPLAHENFLAELLPLLKENGFSVYLETAGFLDGPMNRLKKFVDVVSMDIKLPTAISKMLWDEHERFLREIKGKGFMKVVFAEDSSLDEFERAVSIAERISPDQPFIIQPVTPVPGVESAKKETLHAALELAQSRLKDVRCLTQQHKMWGIR